MNGFHRNVKQQMQEFAWRTCLLFPVIMGWCGLLYPNLTFQNGVCRSYTAEGKERTQLSQTECYEELLQAKPEQIRVKSRLLEFFFSLGEKEDK